MAQAPTTTEEKDEKKPELPRVMILGGCGFIGRHLVQMLIAKKVVSSIKVVDKRAPMTAYFPKSMIELFKDPLVQMIQCDLSRDDLIDKKNLFDQPVEYIINLCGETRFGQSDQDYQTKCLDTAVKCAQRAAKMKGLLKWIEVSTAQVYEPTENAATETSAIAPYTKLASFRLQVEKKLEELKLPVVTLRPSIVYGPGDQTGITPRLVCAACYKHANEKMKFLWTGSLKINTVHVRDVSAAIWAACTESKVGRCYNLSDKGDTTQGSLNALIEKIFTIKTGFQNSLMNAAASKMLATAARTCNDKHLPMWSAVMKQHNLTSTPLSPYLDAEILMRNHTSVNGDYIEKDTKFRYTIPKMTVEYLQEIIEEFVELNYFPNIQKM